MTTASLRRSIVFLMILGLAMAAISECDRAQAQSVEKLPETLSGPMPTLSPLAEDRGRPSASEVGDWAQQAQLVYLARSATMERRAYEVWRDVREAGLIFRWTPLDEQAAAPGRVTGRGLLVWRRPGSASYDTSAIVAVYEGDLREGKYEGRGTYRTSAGFTYEGEWSDGLMHGQGRVALANGDHYVGGFERGRLHGTGRYVDARGEVYEGHFRQGAQDGEGVVTRPDKAVYRVAWRMGREELGKREVISPPLLQIAQADRDFGVAVTVDTAAVYASPVPEDADPSQRASLYRSFASDPTLMIRIDSERIEQVWRANASIAPTDYVDVGFLGIRERDIRPIALVFAFTNGSRGAARITNAWLEVAESVTDREPKLQITTGNIFNCNYKGGRPSFDPTLRLENFGWSPAENGRLTIRFVDKAGHPVDPPVSKFVDAVEDATVFDFSRDLEGLGVDARRARAGFDCVPAKGLSPAAMESAQKKCIAQVFASGFLGQLKAATEFHEDKERLLARLRGEFMHEWVDAGGARHNRKAFFESNLSLGCVRLAVPEKGEGGESKESASKPFAFRLDQRDYRLRVPLSDVVPAGVNARWRVWLTADKSSRHLFRMAFELSDGRTVRSRPIDLLLFRPRTRRG